MHCDKNKLKITGVVSENFYFFSYNFFLIFKQPNLGSALLILGIGFSIFLCSGININLLIKRTTIGSILWLPILYYLIQYSLSEVQKTRITTIFNPFLDAQGNGYQLVNSFIAMGSGGITGRGFGNSIQKQVIFQNHTLIL